MGWAASADPYFSQGALNINFDSAEVSAGNGGGGQGENEAIE